MNNFLMSFFLGILPDVIFLSLFIIFAKSIKTKRTILFILLLIDYIATLIIYRYQTLFYILFIIIEYIILKILYKKDIELIDSFVITFPFLILFLTSCLYYFLIPNYMIACIIHKITLLLLIFLVKNKINIAYKKYKPVSLNISVGCISFINTLYKLNTKQIVIITIKKIITVFTIFFNFVITNFTFNYFFYYFI